MASEKRYSNLELVTRVDGFPYYTDDPVAYKQHLRGFYYFMIVGHNSPFGYVHRDYVTSMPWPSEYWIIDSRRRTLTLHVPNPSFASLSEAMHQTLQLFHLQKCPSSGNHWSDELFRIVNPTTDEHVMDIEAEGVDHFGLIAHGVHMIGYTHIASTNETKYWVPRRSRTKMTYPGMLDSTVGGSLRSKEKPIDCIAREAEEECSIPKEYTLQHVRPVGSLTWGLDGTKRDLPGTEFQVIYVYEMEISENMTLKPNDGEVDEFLLLSLDTVRDKLARGDFKLNCGALWMDYLIRHGILNAENERHLVQMNARLHRRFEIFIVEDL